MAPTKKPKAAPPKTAAANSSISRVRHVVIAGAGVHGLAAAYHLTVQHGVRCTLVERTGAHIAPGASSKAAGFLARHWNDRTPMQQLTRRSFALHQELADRFGAEAIHYRRLRCVQVRVVDDDANAKKRKKQKTLKNKKNGVALEWRPTDDDATMIASVSDMGHEDDIAQVHPRLLCEQLWRACQATGLATLVHGRIVGAQHDDSTGAFQGAVCSDGTVIGGDALLCAAGAWTANIMRGIKGHSLILPTATVLKQTVFFETQRHGAPEVFVRPDSTAFVSGYPGEPVTVEETAGSESIEPEVVDQLLASVRFCMGYPSSQPSKEEEEEEEGAVDGGGDEHKATGSDHGSNIPVSKDPSIVQACYQPCTDDYLPVMGQLSRRAAGGGNGVYMQGGHNCWGILLAPASGEAMAELIVTGKTTHVDLKPFRPDRYRNLKPVP